MSKQRRYTVSAFKGRTEAVRRTGNLLGVPVSDEHRFLGSGSGLTAAGVARKVALWLERADRIEIALERESDHA